MGKEGNAWRDQLWPVIGTLLPYLLFATIALTTIPLDHLLWVGGDDGFELSKMLLLAKHPELSSKIWNDQPWLHTMIHAWLFRHFGYHASFPRLFSLASLGIFLLAASLCFGKKIGFWGGLFFSFVLLSAETFPRYALAAMLELPAQCWAFTAAMLALTGSEPKASWRYLGAGALWAAAVHMKLTAFLLAPALFFALVAKWKKKILLPLIWIGIGFTLAFGFLVWLSPNFNLHRLLGSHIQSTIFMFKKTKVLFTPDWQMLLSQPAILLGTLFFIFFLLGEKRVGPEEIFILGFLDLALLLALFYRPWWDYYMIFLYIPMALLPAMTLHRFIEVVFRKNQKESSGTAFGSFYKLFHHPIVAVGCGAWLVAVGIGFGAPSITSQIHQIQGASRPENLYLWSILKPYEPKTRWIFTFHRSLAFFLKIPIPPELVVISSKRVWSKQISVEEIAKYLRKYRPEIVVLSQNSWAYADGVKKWLKEHYEIVSQRKDEKVWIHQSLHPKKPLTVEEQLRLLGL